MTYPDCETCGRERREAYGTTQGTCRRCVHERDPFVRLMNKHYVTETGCWQWTGCENGSGYGQIGIGGTVRKTHRVMYEWVVGPIPAGLTLDHLCRNRLCINPAHLEPVTRGENVLRGDGVSANRARQTHCHRGHEFTPENTYRSPARPSSRVCRACRKED